MTITDDILSAYLDGELPAVEAANVEAAVKADPRLAERLRNLDAATRRFADAVRDIDRAPTPAAVEALLAPKKDNVVAFRRPPRAAPKWLAPAAMAASLAAIVVVAGNLGRAPGLDAGALVVAAGPLERGSDLHRALDKTPSAEETAVRGGSVRPIATFRVAGGDLCREFLAQGKTHAARAVACRDDRQWTVKIAAEASPATSGGYQPAAGPAGAIDAFIDGAIDGDALGAEEESALIEGGWK